VTTDDEWFARHRERLAKLQAQLEEERRKSEEEAAARRAEREREALSPVQRSRAGEVGEWAKSIGFLLIVVLIIFVAWELSMTLSRFNGDDIHDAKRLGRATVLSCERHGPVGNGFGYWDRCTADVAWDGGQREKLTIDKTGFFNAKEIGHTVTIGDLGNFKNGRAFAREGLPPRPLITVVGIALAAIAVLPSMLLVWAAWIYVKNGVRRLMGKPTDY
jgi:hypothetical protein